MIFEGCQSKSREITITEKICPNCGEIIEIFSIDTEVACDNCGFVAYNDTLSCVQWCKYAKRCVGEEMYEKLMEIAERKKESRKAEDAVECSKEVLKAEGTTECREEAGTLEDVAEREKEARKQEWQDKLVGAMIGLAGAAETLAKVPDSVYLAMIEGFSADFSEDGFDETSAGKLIKTVHGEKEKISPDCSSCQSPCGRTSDYDMSLVWNAEEEIRALKEQFLMGLRGLAANAHRAWENGCKDGEVNRFFCEALTAIKYEEEAEYLREKMTKLEEMNRRVCTDNEK